ncbi:adenosylcobinamide-GDP ribazoletransferase [Dehalogenimonas formicexedens]|uniref:Adenosylcobinamide-GDP ribazoletransferase n=1 Tax=Dehalogenimonas formicexedens TaxID=1839801 RepID=A0A1P8F5P2_9CHLR|nr:adenosylcobinamide-GDP ribazoletransferase [Dehalogenimonas formicexedens]APV43799.1 adenosylcobinamide-GDP ribazoletransferase [Dehalogenimonas formicexedens]
MKTQFMLALQFLTKMPFAQAQTVENRTMARSMSFFSLIGLLIGGASAALYWGLYQIFPPLVAALGAMIFAVLVTGNLHGDGVMDTADGIFSGKPREQMLEIMKDSRVGSHGVMAGVIVVAAKLALLSVMDLRTAMIALVAAPVLGRWAQVYGAARYTYIRSTGIGVFTDHVGWRELGLNSVVTVGVAVALLQLSGLIALGVAFFGTILFFKFIKGKLGGITGDTLGAANEAVEVLAMLAIVFIAHNIGGGL